ncbi:hypothetical protein [Actinoplanes sp. NBRC 101535]|uniref:aa3-type cytochrome oxidase subunit CtaJ n=1 Tax=Actinoplanes sp. NBRC 101535 TaxID=3032196 RepID=UPI000AD7AD21|nr:hypothetical protein [Actinoplanes sp. NBRC 101535]
MIIPAAVIGAVATLVLTGAERGKPSRRYRPGSPFDFPAMWFTASPAQVAPVAGGGHHLVIEDSSGSPVQPGPTGGASGKW